jgi:plastocyanin
MYSRTEKFMKNLKSICVIAIVTLSAVAAPRALGQQAPVTMSVEIIQAKQAKQSAAKDLSNVVIWLAPLDTPFSTAQFRQAPQMVQRNKAFEPHLLVVPAGTVVQFPNKDQFFHNVFSLSNGRRFDLGLYEAGSTKSIHFDHAAVSFLFCNIHSDMSAVILAVDSTYFAVSDKSGNVTLPNVPDGRYEIHVWFERSTPEDLKKLTRVVTISDSTRQLGIFRVTDNPNFNAAHKNMYGQDYVPSGNSSYGHP